MKQRSAFLEQRVITGVPVDGRYRIKLVSRNEYVHMMNWARRVLDGIDLRMKFESKKKFNLKQSRVNASLKSYREKFVKYVIFLKRLLSALNVHRLARRTIECGCFNKEAKHHLPKKWEFKTYEYRPLKFLPITFKTSNYFMEKEILKNQGTADYRFDMNNHTDVVHQQDLYDVVVHTEEVSSFWFINYKKTCEKKYQASHELVSQLMAPANRKVGDESKVILERFNRHASKTGKINIDRRNIMDGNDVVNHSIAIAKLKHDSYMLSDSQLYEHLN
jgi:hypothetical protein